MKKTRVIVPDKKPSAKPRKITQADQIGPDQTCQIIGTITVPAGRRGRYKRRDMRVEE